SQARRRRGPGPRRSGAAPSREDGSEPLEALDRDDEDGGPADLDLERVGHEELARLHDRRHRVDDLGPRGAVLADDRQDLVDLVVLGTDDDRGVRLLEEPARRLEAGRPVLALEEGVDQVAGILVVDDREHELHGPEYRYGREAPEPPE